MSEIFPAESVESESPAYMKWALRLAGLYNLLWGAAVIAFPLWAFQLAGMEPPKYPQIWQCVGMIVGVYGIGYLIAAANPFRHWPIVLVGMLGKILGPIGFVGAALQGDLPWSWGAILVFNDLIWWAPFAGILYGAFRYHTDSTLGRSHDIEEVTTLFASQRGRTLAEISHEQPVMIVFLRHFGCTFCREALQDLSRDRAAIESQGVAIALVHMLDDSAAAKITKQYQLDEIDQFGDPHCEIYRAFGIPRGSLRQLLGPVVFCRGVSATLRGNLIGRLAGDGFRMPGLFFLYGGKVQGSVKYKKASDRPDYVSLAKQLRETLDKDAALV